MRQRNNGGPGGNPADPSAFRGLNNAELAAAQRTRPDNLINQKSFFRPPMTQACADVFLPWLAAGYSMVQTSTGTNHQCGHFALAISMNAAMELFGIVSPQGPVTADTLINVIQPSNAYNTIVNAWMTVAGFLRIDAASTQLWDAQVAMFRAKSMLSDEPISLLLQAANLHYGTEFQLGT